MSTPVEYKIHKQHVNGLADSRLSPGTLGYLMTQEAYPIQEAYVTAFIAYVKSMSVYKKRGIIPGSHQNDEIAAICEAIHDDVLVPMDITDPIYHSNQKSATVDLSEE
jgi:hypothetical protein